MKLNLVLDLDNTLIDARPKINSPGFVIKKRPGLDEFMKFAFNHCDTVSVWSAGMKGYVNAALKHILTPKQYMSLKFIHTRRQCTNLNNMYVKNLRHIFITQPRFNQTNTLLIDDRREHKMFHPKNIYTIPAFEGQLYDRELTKLKNKILRSSTIAQINSVT